MEIFLGCKTSTTEEPPPLTKYYSTHGSKVLKPGSSISMLLKILFIYTATILASNILAMVID